jgi:hypothetical protein
MSPALKDWLIRLTVLAIMIALFLCGWAAASFSQADAQVPPEDSVTTVTEAPPSTTVEPSTTTTRRPSTTVTGCDPQPGRGKPTTTETYYLN